MQSTRRAAFGAIGSIAAASLIAGHAARGAALPSPSHSGERWWALKAQLDKRQAAAGAFGRECLKPACEAAAAEIARLPHTVVEIGNGEWRNGVEQTSPHSTEDPADVRFYREKLARFPTDRQCANPDTPVRIREFIDAYDARCAAAKAIEARHGIPDLEDEDERLSDLAWWVERQLMKLPAPDHAALLWKLERLLEADPGDSVQAWTAAFVAPTVADMRRLLGEA